MEGIHSLEESFASVHSQKPPTAIGWESIVYMGYMRPIETSSVTCSAEAERDKERERRGWG